MRLTLALLAVATSYLLRAADPDQASEAQKELYAARYGRAAELYRNIVNDRSDWAPGYLGLVRALVEDHRAAEAYRVAEEALARVPQTPEGQTAAGVAMFRRGEMAKAEAHFKAALKMNPNYPGALSGVASIYGAISKFASQRALLRVAHNFAPDDPTLAWAWITSREPAEHIAALERSLANLDPHGQEAESLRAHIAADRAVGQRKLRELASPYRRYSVKLESLMSGVKHRIGAGLRVRFNDSQTVTLLLDTGASGIALAPEVMEKAGLESLGGLRTEVHGIGDQKTEGYYRYLAGDVAIGDLSFKNYPVAVFRGVKTTGYAGVIGADVFARFLVGIDFTQSQLTLDPFPDWSAPVDEPQDAGPLPVGFSRAIRFGNHLTVPTLVNQESNRLFLIDSGATANFIDAAVARESTHVHTDELTTVKGVRGKVDKVSRASLVTLVFAGFRQQNPDLLAMDMEKISDANGAAIAGILGMPVLWNMRLTIDYRNGAVRFEYLPHQRLP